ncbi:MAG: hypothetical protein NC483_04840, partial [Ruminococcus sp.]|nr:hypothetical protein [Ruminococcus sp.]
DLEAFKDREAYELGTNDGKEEGRKERDIEIAKNLLLANIPEDVIINSTGLSKEEIKKISKETEKE